MIQIYKCTKYIYIYIYIYTYIDIDIDIYTIYTSYNMQCIYIYITKNNFVAGMTQEKRNIALFGR